VRLVRSSPDAVELCARVVERTEHGAPIDVRVRAHVAAGQLLAAAQHMEIARQHLVDAESIAAGDDQLLKGVLVAEAELANRRGDFRQARDQLDRLQRIVRAKSGAPERHRVLLHLAQAYAAAGDRRAALAHQHEAEQLLPGDRTAALEREKVHALVDYFTREYRSAALHSERAVDMAREMGITYEVMLNLHNLGDALVAPEDHARAYGALRQSLALCEEMGFERLANYNRMLLAYLDGIQGTVDGEKLLRQGIAYAESKDFMWDVVGGHVLLARLLHRRGDVALARGEYLQTRELAVAAGHRVVADECDAALAKLGVSLAGQPKSAS
jgi:eukaryotic-like serine/threonine-protein kinase